MPKPKHPPKQSNRFWRFLKKRPKTSILLVLFLVLVLGFGISQEMQQQSQARKLRLADQKIQQFGNQIEKNTDLKFERTTSCRHLTQKISSGPLVCESSLRFEHQYASQAELDNTLMNLYEALSQQTTLAALRFPTDTGFTRYRLENGTLIDISLHYSSFSDESVKLRGEFSLLVRASEKVHRSIYNYVE